MRVRLLLVKTTIQHSIVSVITLFYDSGLRHVCFRERISFETCTQVVFIVYTIRLGGFALGNRLEQSAHVSESF